MSGSPLFHKSAVNPEEAEGILRVTATYNEVSDSAEVRVTVKKEENGTPDEGGDMSGNSLNTETVTINQDAHPIRKFFSSIFK